MSYLRPTVWKIELRNLFFTLLISGLLGHVFNCLAWALFIGLLIYVFLYLKQLHKVQCWLYETAASKEPPELYGIWGLMLDKFYHLQKKSKEESLRLQGTIDYLQETFASLPDATVMIDERGYIQWSNYEAGRVFGLKYPYDVNTPLINLIRAPEFVSFIESKNYDSQIIISSTIFPELKLQIQVSYFGSSSRIVFARDITENYRLQQMRKDFVANVSHELRTPLTVILGYIENFAASPLGEQKPWNKAIDQMHGQALRMENLVKDLIVLSRIETLPSLDAYDEIKLLPLLKQIRDEALALVPEREINLDVDESLTLMGDEGEIRSAFTNLIVNAVKYSNKNSIVDVRWFAENNSAILDVIDDGDGIAPHHIPRLTERFYRVDESRNSKTGGTGLGLSITKHILIRHQAELKIHSEVGVGSTFRCIFSKERIKQLDAENSKILS